MKKNCILRNTAVYVVIVISIVGNAYSDEGDSLWSRNYGGNSTDEAHCVVQTSDNGYLLIGQTYSFATASYDIWVVKTNSLGDTLWTRAYGGTETDNAYSVIETCDSYYVLAGETLISSAPYNNDMYLIKLNAEGDTVFTRTYGGDGPDCAYSIIETQDLGYLLVGSTSSFGLNSPDVYLLKTDSLGYGVWSHIYGMQDGWERANSVDKCSDGGYIIGGITSTPSEDSDIYAIRINENGDSIWTQIYIDSGADADVKSIFETGDGNYLIAGTQYLLGAGSNMLMLKINSDGNEIWTDYFGLSYFDYGYSAIEASNSEYLIVGGTQPSINTPPDIAVAKANSNGDLLWILQYGGDNSDCAESVVQSCDGNYVIAGYSEYPELLHNFLLMCIEGFPMGVEYEFKNKSFVLSYVAHPNPFNPTTTLSFQLPVAGWVQLSVFDVTGRNVGARHAVPVGFGESNLRYYPPGTHHILFDGSDLPSGIYFARLQAGDLTQTQKLVLLK